MTSPSDSTAHLLAWATQGKPHVCGSAIRILLRQLGEGEPNTVEYLLRNATELAERHPTAFPSSKRSYAARVRTACHEYLGRPPHDRKRGIARVISALPAPRPLTPQEQISEALLGCSRWPDLQRYLMPALLRAMTELDAHDRAKETA